MIHGSRIIIKLFNPSIIQHDISTLLQINWREYISPGPSSCANKTLQFEAVLPLKHTITENHHIHNTTIMTNPLAHAKIVLRRSSERGYAEHGGWLKSFHTFSFAGYYDHKFTHFGSLRVLNEDRVAARNGFPTHPHRDAEIFSYILNGELTHRDSMIKKGAEGEQGKSFYRMQRGDVQFTTGGSGKFFLEIDPAEI